MLHETSNLNPVHHADAPKLEERTCTGIAFKGEPDNSYPIAVRYEVVKSGSISIYINLIDITEEDHDAKGFSDLIVDALVAVEEFEKLRPIIVENYFTEKI